MTAVYLYDLEAAPPDAALAERLPRWRRERYDRLRNEAARRESLGAGLLFAYAMRRRGISPEEPIQELPAGKPVFARREDVFFSLSHSGRYVLCAVSGAPVGVDVQQIRPVRLSLVRRFHPAEQAWLEDRPEEERQVALFRLWTRKEAWVKAVSGDHFVSLSEADVIHPLQGLLFRDYEVPGGYHASVCAAEGELPEEIQQIALSELSAI